MYGNFQIANLVLGTAQFGLPYGIANRSGQPDEAQASDLISCAYELGLRMLDTATAYGESEEILGKAGVGKWKVITKVPSLNKENLTDITTHVRVCVERSLERLRLDRLHAVLAHDAYDLVGTRGNSFASALQELKAEGLVEKIGVSVYGAADMEGIDGAFSPDVVQAPGNILDRRFAKSPQAAFVRKNGGELHARSVFLQGLLLMAPEERPAYFHRWRNALRRFDERARSSDLSPLALCLAYVLRDPAISRFVVGLERVEQLVEIVDTMKAVISRELKTDDLTSEEPALLDPRQWDYAK